MPSLERILRTLASTLPSDKYRWFKTKYFSYKKLTSNILSKIPLIGSMEGYKRLLDQVPFFDNISVLPTNKSWEDKWRVCNGKRILFYSEKDFSGSLYKWAEAINKYTDYAARLITSKAHQYGYATDILSLENIPTAIAKKNKKLSAMRECVLKLVEEATVVHFKEELKLFIERHDSGCEKLSSQILNTAKLKKIPLVFTANGGYARKYHNDSEYIKFVQGFDRRIAMTPDLNYDWFSGSYIPHAIDTEAYPYSWKDGYQLSHSPSSSKRKGTKEFLEAVARIDRKKLPLQLDVIQNVSYQECLKRKENATIFFDQAGRDRNERWRMDEIIGWYGNSAIEAMTFGIPTIAHLSEEALLGAERAGVFIRSICPVINVGCEDSESLLNAIVGFFNMTASRRKALSLETREWAENFHSYYATAKRLQEVYDSLHHVI